MSQYPSLAGRVVILTGAGRGLGRVMALALLDQGARLMLTGSRALDELQALAAQAPDACRAMVADVAVPRACEQVVAEALRAFGRIDVLINNAGIPSYVAAPEPGRSFPFWQADAAGYRRVVETNVLGPFLMARAAVPQMLAQGFGKIVNVSTSRPTMVLKGGSPYGATKAALEATTVVWAKDLEGSGVTANVLLPGGACDTGFIWGDGMGARTASDFRPGKGPPGREGDTSTGLLPPTVMAAPVLWLCADESNAVTGRRVVARDWDPDLPPAEAAARAMTAPHDPPSVM